MKSELSIILKEAAEKTAQAIQVYQKSVKRLSPFASEFLKKIDQAQERELEPYDALTSRFERSVEMVLGKLAKSVSLYEGGNSQATLRDRLNLMEKLGLIESVDLWFEMREVRNRIAHEYSGSDLANLYERILFSFPPAFNRLEKQLAIFLKSRLIQ